MRNLIFAFLVLFILNFSAHAQTELAQPIVPPSSSVNDASIVQAESEAAALIKESATDEKTATVKPTAAPVSETDIKVQLDAPKKTATEESVGFKMIMSLVIVSFLGGGGYFLIGKYRRAQIGKNSAPEIKILRQHYLGPKKSLAIIRVAGESLLIGVTDHNINMIKSLSLLDEDVPEETPTRFASVFQKEEIIEPRTAKSESQEGEDFSITGIRDFVSTRLKNMRNLE